jgi:hypothetical protein
MYFAARRIPGKKSSGYWGDKVRKDYLADQIRETITVTAVLEHYGYKPDRRGKMRCPFHLEKTPSFTVDKTDRNWHCYGCAAHGDVFDIVERLQDVNYPEAIAIIASDFGLDKQEENTKQGRARRRPRDRKLAQIRATRDFDAMMVKRYAEIFDRLEMMLCAFERCLCRHPGHKTITELRDRYMDELESWKTKQYYFEKCRRGTLVTWVK